MAAYNIKDIKDKKKLINLANYGTAERKLMRPRVLIGAGKEKPFIEGDILDANATLNLIEDTYDKDRIFRSFSKEGKKIDKEIKELLEKTDENYEQLSSAIADNKEDADQKIDQLSSKVDNIESNIPNLRRVVDIQLQSVLDGTKTYLVTKQGDVQEQIQISDGEKGEQGEKGDPFTYEDFTPEQIEGLKVKGDRGISISSLEQTQTAYTSGGVNEFTVTLDDGTVSRWYVRNGQKGDATKIWVNANTVHSGYYDSGNHEIKLLNADGGIMSIIDATAFIKDGMISDAYVENGYIVIVFNTDAGQTPIMIPVTDIFDADDYYTKLDTDARIAEDVLVETQRAEAAELQLTDDLAQEVSDRLSGDTALDTKIETETTRATTAEGLLDQRVTSNNAAILAEAARAAAAESALSDAIDAEESTRIQEIDDLQNLLDAYIQSNDAAVQAEITRATTAEGVLQDNIDAEETRATTAEQANATAISTETSRAQSAELALLGAINTEASTRAAAITAEETRATTAEQALQDNIDAEEQRAIAAELDLQDAIDAVEQGAGQDTAAVEQALNGEISRATLAEQLISSNLSAEITRSTNADNANSTAISNEISRATAAEQQNASDIDAIEALIPSLATSSNQLADKAFVNSSIATSTATFVGTFNDITDLYAVTTADANDYGYVITTDSAGNTKYNRYKYDGSQWDFEYALNNSSFTAEEWAAIQSGMTQALRIKLENLPSTAVTSVGVSVPTGLTVTGSPITSSGTIAINFTSGYSIPTTSSLTNWDTAYGWGNHANANYVKSVKVGTTAYNPSSGIVSLPAYPTTLPASDVYSWAKASTKPSYTWSEITNRPATSAETGNGGPLWGSFVPVKSDGVMEVGKYIDFHNVSQSGIDYDVRLECSSGVTGVNVVLPTASGTLALTSQIPTTLPASDVYSWAKASTKPSYTLDEVSDGSTRKLANYLPLSGGTITGGLTVRSGSFKVGVSLEDETYKYYHALYMGTHGVDHMDFYELVFNFYNNGGGTPTLKVGSNTVYHSGNLTNVSQLTNDSGYITSSGSITGNAGSATKLQTARTIWGQSFDGSANVSGKMSNVDGINNVEGKFAIGDRSAIGTSTGDANDFLIGHTGTDKVNARMLLFDQRYVHIHPIARVGTYSDASTPSHTLDVAGTLGVTGATTLGSNLSIAGNIGIDSGKYICIGTVGGGVSPSHKGYISAGVGYSVDSGRYGLKILACDQADCQSGLGQDLATPTGWNNAYNFCVACGNSSTDYGYLSFVSHKVNSTAYRYLGGFYDNAGTVKFQVQGDILASTLYENGNRVTVNTINKTWSELKAMRDGGTLVPGQWYRITDFVTTTTQSDTLSAGHAFDIIIVADATNKLNENAHAALHSGDTYFANSKLESWKLWYCIDNDTTRFTWADTTNGKGVVYRMIDQSNNDLPYDFKNIQFKRFRVLDSKGRSDINGGYSWYTTAATPNNISIPNQNDFIWAYTFTEKFYDFEEGITLISDTSRTLTGGARSNVFKLDDLYSVRINNNVLYDICIGNVFGPGASGNTIYNSARNNIIGKGFVNNIIARSFIQNKLISSFSNNICETGFECNFCYRNVSLNNFGKYCLDNVFGNNFTNNTTAENFMKNTFGNNCLYCDFLKNYFLNNIVEGDIRDCIITSTQTTSVVKTLRNIKLCLGVNSNASTKTISHNTVQDTFLTEYKATNSVIVNV